MNALIEQLARQGKPYGIRRDGSIFTLRDEHDVVEMGFGAPEPADVPGHQWIVIDGRWVLIDRRVVDIAASLEATG